MKWRGGAVFIASLLLILAAVRFANLALLWHATKQELQNKNTLGSVDYTFLGFSSEAKAAQELKRRADFRGQPLSIVCFYNYAYPARFLAHNRAAAAMVDLGRVIIQVCPGESAVTLYASGWLTQQCEEERRGSIEEPLLRSLLDQIAGHSPGAREFSFLSRPPSRSDYLKIPYLFYFFAPLVLIVLLSLRFGPGFLIAALYYVELFLLFDFKEVLVAVPFSWLLSQFNLEITDPLAWGLAAVLVCLAVAASVAGLYHYKQLRDQPWGKWLILFILLLPLALRF
jgi:hypothetical protein